MILKPRMNPRTVALIGLVGASTFAIFLSCGEEEGCTDHRDCATNEECVDGLCVPDEGSGIIPRDASVRDASVTTDAGDAGVASDAGSGGDAALNDAAAGDASARDGSTDASTGDAGSTDTGSRADAGAGTVVPNAGLVWARELYSVSVAGFFLERSTARYSVDTESFDLGQEGRCNLRVERIVSGTYSGFSLERIEVTTSSILPTILLAPLSTGFYWPAPTQPTDLFDGSLTSATFELVAPAGSPSNPLESASAEVPIPAELLVAQPGFETAVIVPTSVNVAWTPSAMSDDLVVELYDAQRTVVLTCVTPDDGTFVLPMNATEAWRDGGPSGNKYFDVRYDREVEVIVGPVALPVTFRASRGQSYTVVVN